MDLNHSLNLLAKAAAQSSTPNNNSRSTWATVTSVNPLQVVLDEDITGTPRDPSENAVGNLRVDQRVRVSYDGARLVITEAPSKVDALFGTTIPANADFNSYTTPGQYYSPSNADMATMSNRPSGNAGALVVLRAADVIQYWHEYNTGSSGRILRRRRQGSSWSSWELMWSNALNTDDAIIVGGNAYPRSGSYDSSAEYYSGPDFTSVPIYIWNVTKSNPFTPPSGWVFKPHVITSNGYTFVEMASQTSTYTTIRMMNINSSNVSVRLGWTLVKA